MTTGSLPGDQPSASASTPDGSAPPGDPSGGSATPGATSAPDGSAPPGDPSAVPGTAKPPVTVTFRLVNGAVRALMAIFRVTLIVEDGELLPDRPGVILASNHLSWADPVLLAIAVHEATGRRVRHMAKAEAVAVPVFGLLLKDYGGFAVRRGRPDREAFRMARDVLAGGDWLGLAPEGTRSRTGTLGEAKPGVALLATRSGADVVPAAIWGSEHLWPVGKLLPRPGRTVHIRFGTPFRPAVGGGTGPDAAGGVAEPAAGVAAVAGAGGAASGVPGHAVDAAIEAETGGTSAERGSAGGEPDAGTRRRSSGEKRAALEATTDDLMRRIAALLPEEYRGRFG